MSALCPRCQGTGEEVLHQPRIIDDPGTITFTVCGRCHGDGTLPRMSLERAALEHQPFTDSTALHCTCGYETISIPDLDAHYAFYGIRWNLNPSTRQLEWSRA